MSVQSDFEGRRTRNKSDIEATLDERTHFATPDQVRTRVSLAKAERQLGHEYHGRFLIELLQNASDAWGRIATDGGRSSVHVVLTEEPALLVANHGELVTAQIVIASLGQIGASTKAAGEAIGHKGIGFKSLLEITETPEIYSGFGEDKAALSVRFDARRALEEIRKENQDWTDLLEQVIGLGQDPLEAISVLQYPWWVDEIPVDVRDLADREFDSVVRVPLDDSHIETVRRALDEVSDEIVLLLDSFEQVVLEDRTIGTRHSVSRVTVEQPREAGAGVSAEQVEIRRNGAPTSRWRLYRQILSRGTGLEGEITVAVPFEVEGETSSLLRSDAASRPFHLVFPTRILSGTPFLLNGYFEVDAGRTHFYGGSRERNWTLLERLAELIAVAVGDLARSDDARLTPLAELLGSAPVPEDELARDFREMLLGLLDVVPWVPTAPGEDVPSHVAPIGALAFEPVAIFRLMTSAFTPSYARLSTGDAQPAHEMKDPGIAFLAGRRSRANRPDLWEAMWRLLRPGDRPPWQSGQEDGGFRALLNLVDALDRVDRSRANALIEELRGDPATRVIPVVASGGRELRAVSELGEGALRRRGELVLARLREKEADELIPPPDLQVSFVADGMLDTQLLGPAAKFGIREYAVDTILDRIDGLDVGEGGASSVVAFVWRLLAQESRSEFGLRRCVDQAERFDPLPWAWFRAGRAGGSDQDRQRQDRERGLATLLLPARSGSWARAGELAFGADWGDWLERGAIGPQSATTRERAAAYRDLETLAPNDDHLLASPSEISSLLQDTPLNFGEELGDLPEAVRLNITRHAFLLRLGVWEVPPVEAFIDLLPRSERRFPDWGGRLQKLQEDAVQRLGGWRFGGAPYEHDAVNIGEDYRFRWTFPSTDPLGVARAIARGSTLYEACGRVSAFCPRCHSHTQRYRSGPNERFPSTLAIQLRHDPWLACTKDGNDVPGLVAATEAWWEPRSPHGAALKQSPLRYLLLVRSDADLSESLRRLAGLPQLEDADIERIASLLTWLRHGFESDTIDPRPLRSGSERTAFIGIHRRAYERLANLIEGGGNKVHDTIGQCGVLCEIGDHLAYGAIDEVRHDDGRYAAYRRHFSGSLPFVALAKDQDAVARSLGIQPFSVELVRRGGDEGRDVTGEMAELFERVSELLAISVNYPLGAQTMELGSRQFQERSRRLLSLRVVQVQNLVLDATVSGMGILATIGEEPPSDLFLEGPTSVSPILYHDMNGEGWPDRLRRKIAPHLAALLENSNYTHTFALFLQEESDSEREEFLVELGITPDDVDAVREAMGVVSEADREHERRWFAAILRLLGASPASEAGREFAGWRDELVAVGLEPSLAAEVARLGGGMDVRGDLGPSGALRLLRAAGIDLGNLHDTLIASGDIGLSIHVAADRLREWRARFGGHVAAVLAVKMTEEEAKRRPDEWRPDPRLEFELDPDQIAVLAPVLADLAEFEPDAASLARDPISELARLAGCAGAKELSELVTQLYDDEERDRLLRAQAFAWRRCIRLVAVVVQAGTHEPRSAIRTRAEQVDRTLPPNPERPSELKPLLEELLSAIPTLVSELRGLLIDSLTAPPPSREELASLLAPYGIDAARLKEVERILAAPARDQARRLLDQVAKLRETAIGVKPPTLVGPKISSPLPPKRQRRPVSTHHVGPSEAVRRRLGDEGERWALAAVLQPLLEVDFATRRRAIDEVLGIFVERFSGPLVEAARSHAEAARSVDIDEEELTDELTEFLYVARRSDEFGFDMLGWLSPSEGKQPIGMCLEVKSSPSGEFHLSAGEWKTASDFNETGAGMRYAVLVVRRSKTSGTPERLDLLLDPVTLCDEGLLSRREDGYVMRYRSE